jgi:hypothetical protein
MLEDVMSPEARKRAYVVYKWLGFLVGLASVVVAGLNYDNAQVLLWLATGNAAVNFIGAAIGKVAQDNTVVNGEHDDW